MIAYGMPLSKDFCDQLRIFGCFFTYYEKSGLQLMPGQKLKQNGSRCRRWTIVKG